MASKDTYLAYLDEIIQVVDFVDAGALLRPQLNKFLIWEGLGNLRETVQRFMNSQPIVDRVYQSLLVSCHAGFEQFIIDLAEESCIGIGKMKLSSQVVEERFPGLIDRFRHAAGSILSSKKSRAYWRIDKERLVSDLGSTSVGSSQVNVLGRSFIVSVGSVDSGALVAFVQQFGLSFSWDNFAKHDGVSKVLKSSGVRETSKLAQTMMDELNERRNLLAHSQGALVVGREYLNSAVSFYKCLSDYLSQVFSVCVR